MAAFLEPCRRWRLGGTGFASRWTHEHRPELSPGSRKGAKAGSRKPDRQACRTGLCIARDCMERLPPIPSPPGHLWRLFCIRVVPLLVFGGAALAAAVLWRHQGGGRMFVAIGEGARAQVLAPQPGTLVEVLVAPYAVVRRGDPLAVVQAFDPRGDLDRMRLRLDMARLLAAPSLADASAVDLERLRLDLARTRAELATAQVRLEFATREVNRLEPLFRDRLIAEDTMELSRGTRDVNAAEVREKEQLTRDLQARLEALELRQALVAGAADAAASTGAILDPGSPEHLAGTNLVLATLTAPIDGTVGPWLRRPGEFVVEGEPVLVVHGAHAERIVGYLRQPIGFEPRAGLSVQVSRRTFPKQRFPSVIRHVGSQFEAITNALAFIRDGVLIDVGLPVVIEVSPEHPVRPGELVDVVVDGPAGSPSLAAGFPVINPR